MERAPVHGPDRTTSVQNKGFASRNVIRCISLVRTLFKANGISPTNPCSSYRTLWFLLASEISRGQISMRWEMEVAVGHSHQQECRKADKQSHPSTFGQQLDVELSIRPRTRPQESSKSYQWPSPRKPKDAYFSPMRGHLQTL